MSTQSQNIFSERIKPGNLVINNFTASNIAGTFSGTLNINLPNNSGLTLSNGSIAINANSNSLTITNQQLQLASTITGNRVFANDVTIQGFLNVTGSQSISNVQNLSISNSFITLIEGATGSPTLNASVNIQRGTEPTAKLLWNENTDTWSAGLSGSETTILLNAGFGLTKSGDTVSLDLQIEGPTGPAGPTGIQGYTGPQGDPGVNGPPGDQGPTGITGFQGETGPQGDQGVNGSTGTQGPTGLQGETGIQGYTGPQGQTGEQGSTGPSGLTGETGPQGVTGLQGPTGVGLNNGDPIKFTTGATALSFDAGTISVLGNIVPDVNVSYSLGSTTSRWNETFTKDLYVASQSIYLGDIKLSTDGVNLLVNEQSIVAANSTEFYFTASTPIGATYGEFWLHSETGYLYVFINDGNTEQWIGAVSGQKGETGPQGSGTTGAQGFTGQQGNTGPQGTGPQGIEGPTGVQGVTGQQGNTGPQGTGPQGIAGPTGIQGFTGVQGPTGNQGNTGPQGLTGLQGITGPAGSILSTTFSQQQLTVTHSFGYYPIVQAFDGNGIVLSQNDYVITHLSLNAFTATFSNFGIGGFTQGTIVSGGAAQSFTVDNASDNRVLTSTGTATGSNAEANLTFDGSLLTLGATSSLTMTGTASLTGHTIFAETSEVINTTPGATATSVTYDFLTGSIWYHSTASTNYSANFTNLPTTNNRAITATIIISQGATGYSPTSVRIDGVTQSIKWSSGTYSVSTNKVDIVGFTFLRSGNAWSQVFGQISSFS